MSNQELKPCPFCGSQKLTVYFEFVECADCGATGANIKQSDKVADNLDPYDTCRAAREAWNNRQQPETPQQPPNLVYVVAVGLEIQQVHHRELAALKASNKLRVNLPVPESVIVEPLDAFVARVYRAAAIATQRSIREYHSGLGDK